MELGKDILAMAKSPHIPSKFKKQSMDFGHMLLPGRRSRRPSTDAGPINIILESSVVEEKVPKVPVVRKEIALAKSVPKLLVAFLEGCKCTFCNQFSGWGHICEP